VRDIEPVVTAISRFAALFRDRRSGAQEGGICNWPATGAWRDPERIKAAIRRMKEIAAGQTLGGDWREVRDAGRRW